MNRRLLLILMLIFSGYTFAAVNLKNLVVAKPQAALPQQEGWQKGPGFGQCKLFNDSWKFHYGDDVSAKKVDFNDSGWRKLDLPHDWSVEMPASPYLASCTIFLSGGLGCYRTDFTVCASVSGFPTSLLFAGVSLRLDVWLSGYTIGT